MYLIRLEMHRLDPCSDCSVETSEYAVAFIDDGVAFVCASKIAAWMKF